MGARMPHLAALTKAVAAQQPDQFEWIVTTAYLAGVSREDLLTALEVARVLADAPGPVVVQAYATIHAWCWLAARHGTHRRELVPQGA